MTPKFNFVPERQIGKDIVPAITRLSIYSNGQLIFNEDYIDIYELEGKFVRFFADTEKKTIGWMVIEGKTNLEDLGDARKIKKDVHGVCKLSVTKLLSYCGIPKKTKFARLEVKNYKSTLYPLPISYIELPFDTNDTFVLNGVTQK